MSAPKHSRLAQVEARLADVARRQQGVFTRGQAIDCGFTASTIDRRLAAGSWVAVQRGVYAFAASTDSGMQRVMAAVLAAGPGAVASHLTAAALWDLGDTELDTPYHVTVPQRCRRRLPGVVLHTTTTLRPVDRGLLRDVPATAPARTIGDTSSLVDAATTEDLLIEGLRRGLVKEPRMWEVLDLLPTAAGTATARAILRNLDPRQAERLMSRAETWFLARVVRAHAFPDPHVNRRLHDASGALIARVDFSWDGGVVEVDGLRFHSSPRQKEYDDHRQNEIVLSGRPVLRYSARTVRDRPDYVASQLRRLLGEDC